MDLIGEIRKWPHAAHNWDQMRQDWAKAGMWANLLRNINFVLLIYSGAILLNQSRENTQALLCQDLGLTKYIFPIFQ